MSIPRHVWSPRSPIQCCAALFEDGNYHERCTHWPPVRHAARSDPYQSNIMLSDAFTYVNDCADVPSEHVCLVRVRIVAFSAHENEMLDRACCSVAFFFDSRRPTSHMFDVARRVCAFEHWRADRTDEARGVFNDEYADHELVQALRGDFFNQPFGHSLLVAEHDDSPLRDALIDGSMRGVRIAKSPSAVVDEYMRAEHRSTFCVRQLNTSADSLTERCGSLLSVVHKLHGDKHAANQALEPARQAVALARRMVRAARSIRHVAADVTCGGCHPIPGCRAVDASELQTMQTKLCSDYSHLACNCFMLDVITAHVSRAVTVTLLLRPDDGPCMRWRAQRMDVPRFRVDPHNCPLDTTEHQRAIAAVGWQQSLYDAMCSRLPVPATHCVLSADELVAYAKEQQFNLWNFRDTSPLERHAALLANTLHLSYGAPLRLVLQRFVKPEQPSSWWAPCVRQLHRATRDGLFGGRNGLDDATRFVFGALKRHGANRRLAVTSVLNRLVGDAVFAADYVDAGWTALAVLMFVANCDELLSRRADAMASELERVETQQAQTRAKTQQRRERRRRLRLKRLKQRRQQAATRRREAGPVVCEQVRNDSPSRSEASAESDVESSNDDDWSGPSITSSMSTSSPMWSDDNESQSDTEQDHPNQPPWDDPPPLPPLDQWMQIVEQFNRSVGDPKRFLTRQDDCCARQPPMIGGFLGWWDSFACKSHIDRGKN